MPGYEKGDHSETFKNAHSRLYKPLIIIANHLLEEMDEAVAVVDDTFGEMRQKNISLVDKDEIRRELYLAVRSRCLRKFEVASPHLAQERLWSLRIWLLERSSLEVERQVWGEDVNEKLMELVEITKIEISMLTPSERDYLLGLLDG